MIVLKNDGKGTKKEIKNTQELQQCLASIVIDTERY